MAACPVGFADMVPQSVTHAESGITL